MMGLAIMSALLCELPDLTCKRGTEIFFAGETFHIDYDVGGTDPSHTLSHALSLSLLWLCERRKELETEQERERERERDGAGEGAS